MFASKFIAISALVSSVFAAGAMINTPATLVQCQPTALSWSGGVAPYFLAVIPGGNAQGAALLNFGEQTGTSYTWIVNITSGTSISLAITDSTGVINYSSPVTILAGTSSSCIGSAAAVPATTAAAGAGAGAATSASVPRTSASAAPATSAAAAASSAAAVIASAPSSAASGTITSAASTASGTAAAVAAKTTSGATTLTVSSLLVAAAAFAFIL